MVAAVVMFFTNPLYPHFWALYTFCGISDMIDGAVARKLGTAGGAGARLDTVADLVFFLSVGIKFVSILPVFALWAAALIAAIKIASVVICAVKFKKTGFLHTYMNKITGVALFLLLYLIFLFIDLSDALIYSVCAIAFVAALEEMLCVIKMREYDPEFKGVFI